MTRVLTSAATLCVAAVCVSPGAARAEGLYEPFPSVASKARAKRFIQQLPATAGRHGRPLSEEELERGVFVRRGSGLPPRSSAASSRATGPVELGPSFGWALLGLTVAAAAGVVVLRQRRALAA